MHKPNRIPTLSDIVGWMGAIAADELAESWDNVGLQIGDPNRSVSSIWVSLDPTPEVVSAARDDGADLLITHHPLFFRPVRSIHWGSPAGKIIRIAAESGLAIFSAHTNLDSARGGVNDVLAETIGCRQIRPLTGAGATTDIERGGTAQAGLGRVGTLATPMRLLEFAAFVRGRLGGSSVRMAGNPELTVSTVAVCSGSGSSLFDQFVLSGADVYVTGDLGYHNGRDAEAMGKGLIDVGHFASEHLMVAVLAERLTRMADEGGFTVTVTASDVETDPFSVV